MIASKSALQLAAQAWCAPETAAIEMDTRLASEFARIIDRLWSVPYLGNATTSELLNELTARIEVAGLLRYRTTNWPRPEVDDGATIERDRDRSF